MLYLPFADSMLVDAFGETEILWADYERLNVVNRFMGRTIKGYSRSVYGRFFDATIKRLYSVLPR